MDKLMRSSFAYSFRSALALPDILARLNRLGPWRWIERDSDRFGDYMSASPLAAPDRVIVKLVEEDGAYVVNVHVDSVAAAASLDRLHDELFTQILPAIAARDVTETSTLD